jgi:hypothetical protein
MDWWLRLLKRRQMETALESEIQFHIDLHVAAKMEAGMTDGQAPGRPPGVWRTRPGEGRVPGCARHAVD